MTIFLKLKEALQKGLNKQGTILILKDRSKLHGVIESFDNTHVIIRNDRNKNLVWTISLEQIDIIVTSNFNEPEETKWLNGYSPGDLK